MRLLDHTQRCLLQLLAPSLLAAAAGAQIGPEFSSPQAGVIGDHSITVAGMNNPFLRQATFLSGDYSGGPFGVQDCLTHKAFDDWQATFSPPIPGLLWYGQSTRGFSGTLGGAPTDYTFSRPFTILSGFSAATIVGNTLSLPPGTFHSGILHFGGETQSLTCTTTCTEANRQTCTFAQLNRPFGLEYCDPAVTNSSGSPAAIAASGSDFVQDNLVTIEVTSLPSNVTGMFLTSQTQGFVAMPGGSFGNLCLGGAIGRLQGPGQVQAATPMGVIDLTLDLTRQPNPLTGTTSVMAGESWNYQLWYRDVVGGMAVSNFSNGVELAFR